MMRRCKSGRIFGGAEQKVGCYVITHIPRQRNFKVREVLCSCSPTKVEEPFKSVPGARS